MKYRLILSTLILVAFTALFTLFSGVVTDVPKIIGNGSQLQTESPNQDKGSDYTSTENSESNRKATSGDSQETNSLFENEKTTLKNLSQKVAADTPVNLGSSDKIITDNQDSSSRPKSSFYLQDKKYDVRQYKPAAMPNDPNANQWWVNSVKLSQAWDTPRGSNETVLAVIDTGFALGHQEFANRWYQNQDEVGTTANEAVSMLNCTDRSLSLSASCNLIDDNADGILDNESGAVTYENASRLNCSDQSLSLDKSCNLIDDDGNGHIDDVTGWDFINNDPSVQAGELNQFGDGTTHGTAVTGVAAATGNNSVGIAGADWGTKILPIQAMDDDSYGDTLSVGRSIRYAVEQGADVISLSLGSELPDNYVKEAVAEALRAGVPVVAAAGNDGCQCILYPANYPEAFAVGATNTSDQRASFSSWGSNLDIVAPGTNILTTSWSSGNQTTAYASGVNGTSFSTPLVAGLMTRILSQQPTATQQQLMAALTENTNRLGMASTAPHSVYLGYGMLDAQKSTSRMSTSNQPAQLNVFSDTYKGNYFNPSSPLELGGSYSVHDCISSTTPSSFPGVPVFELVTSGRRIYTISELEKQSAQQLGYAAGFFTYACLSQPHDQPQSIRLFNTALDFKNLFLKQ